MKALILAAGLGTRLGDLTKELPKCLMPIGSTTILGLVIENLKRAGVDALVVNLHHHADKVRAYLEQNGHFGVSIEYSYEVEPLETGGGVLFARPYLEDQEHFFVHNADIYSDTDLRAAWQSHTASDSAVTLLTMHRTAARYILFDQKQELVGWEIVSDGKLRMVREVQSPARLAFSGISILSRKFFAFLEKHQGKFTAPTVWLEAAAAQARVQSFPIDGSFWIDVGTPDDLTALRNHLALKQ